jgi:hypothetical protein
VHKSIRQRLKFARADEISSAYDLALVIIDEASRVFFDRTKTNDKQPNMVDMFADAIRGVTYKQTAAFDQFLIYTDLASREYKRQRNADTATQNHLLNINSEGSLLKEVKDIMDEIHIITRIKEQQQIVMESFVKHLRRAIAPGLRAAMPDEATVRPGSSSWDAVMRGMTPSPWLDDDHGNAKQRDRRERARLTLARADHLLRDIQDRIFELNTLLENARNTSAAVSALPNRGLVADLGENSLTVLTAQGPPDAEAAAGRRDRGQRGGQAGGRDAEAGAVHHAVYGRHHHLRKSVFFFLFSSFHYRVHISVTLGASLTAK